MIVPSLPCLAADHLEPAGTQRAPCRECREPVALADTVRPVPLMAGDLVMVTVAGTVEYAKDGAVLVQPLAIEGVRRPDTRLWAGRLEVERVDEIPGGAR